MTRMSSARRAQTKPINTCVMEEKHNLRRGAGKHLKGAPTLNKPLVVNQREIKQREVSSQLVQPLQPPPIILNLTVCRNAIQPADLNSGRTGNTSLSASSARNAEFVFATGRIIPIGAVSKSPLAIYSLPVHASNKFTCKKQTRQSVELIRFCGSRLNFTNSLYLSDLRQIFSNI